MGFELPKLPEATKKKLSIGDAVPKLGLKVKRLEYETAFKTFKFPSVLKISVSGLEMRQRHCPCDIYYTRLWEFAL